MTARTPGTDRLGDFTTSPRVVLIAGLAVGIGLLAAAVALALLKTIALFTNIFFFGRWSAAPASPADHALGPWVVAVPVAGAFLVALLARYGSDRIRGHGIPEAIEAILLRGGRVEPRVACAVVGLLAGALSALLTLAVYAAEDAFAKLPFHWMWWPPIGGLVVGLGGLVFPQALGVGYETIGALVQGDASRHVILGILLVKSAIWAVSLGSGTSGGVLAPLLMMGGALGGLETAFLPDEGAGFWPLVSMGAILGGTMRSPLTGVVFALELTHDVNVLLPLLVASVIAHGFTVLTLRRSILTEKVSRRGYHLSREYSVDPLEILFVREVMRTSVVVLPAELALGDLAGALRHDRDGRAPRLYPVVKGERLVGVVTRTRLLEWSEAAAEARLVLGDRVPGDAAVAHPDEPLRVVVDRMASTGLTRFPVVERDGARLLGMISLSDLLQARVRNLDAERRRERVLPLHALVPWRGRPDPIR